MKYVVTTTLYSVILCVMPAAHATILYNTVPSSQPPGLQSWPYEVDQTAQYGGLIQLAGNVPANLSSAIVAMADYAQQASWPGVGTNAGFTIPLTLNLYSVNPDQTVGALFDSVTVSALIPWSPATGYPDGFMSTVTFNLAGIAAPAEFIYGVAFNTQDYGASPTGTAGPYNSLNFAFSTDDPTAGTNPAPNTVYLNTLIPGYYTDGYVATPPGSFRQDQGETWTGAVQFDGTLLTTTPEPSTLFLVALSMIGLAARKYFPSGHRKLIRRTFVGTSAS